MDRQLSTQFLETITEQLGAANRLFNSKYFYGGVKRQPIHTVYGGAHLFSANISRKMMESALRVIEEYAPDGRSLMRALDVKGELSLWKKVHFRIGQKIRTEAVEDFRIDFEDGYGHRSDEEEDDHARTAALEVSKGMQQQILPPYVGIRIKPFSDELKARSLRTLDIFFAQLLSASNGKIPENFVVTLPKVIMAAQCGVLTKVLGEIEKRAAKKNSIKFEFMVETPQAILNDQGICPLREFVAAGEGRCVAAHFGTYDYTAGCDITAHYQSMDNPVCNFAKDMMKVGLAGTGIWLSDGATNVMPIGPHRQVSGHRLTTLQSAENVRVVRAAWRLSFRNIRHSLRCGFYQGWDLHPAQLPVRYAATYSFFLEGLGSATERLKSFVDKAAKATLLREVFDDAATGQGLLNFFVRGLSCGALSEEEVLETGLSLDEIRSRSFLKILENRQKL